jgi:hypothetical protein
VHGPAGIFWANITSFLTQCAELEDLASPAKRLRGEASPGRRNHSHTTVYILFVNVYKIYSVASE